MNELSIPEQIKQELLHKILEQESILWGLKNSVNNASSQEYVLNYGIYQGLKYALNVLHEYTD